MVAQQMVQDRPSIFRRMILVGTAPRGGEDIMHLEKPRLAKHIQDPANRGYDVLQKIFFTPSPASQAAARRSSGGSGSARTTAIRLGAEGRERADGGIP